MQLPQIRMQSQMAHISIQQTSGKQTIQQSEATLSIQQPKAEIKIQTTPSKLQIDQKKAWEDMNLLHVFKRIEKFANEGLQGANKGTARRVQQGDALMRIENKGNPIASQAIQNSFDQMKQLGIKFIPSASAVKINYQPSDVTVDVQTNKPIIQAEENQPVHTYLPRSVEIGMKNYQSLEIDFENLFFT
ncbi:DUF6470 family protein [Virgibacillus necropolis]|uniref:Uncharacterized protein n=1 Tax=Virgibacillus necropolis TaxID=163877 RepID=A0A221MAS1_9BACI|nr:DUF6470 family protein [Virgibacillus necropolis]ASN04727.1 hypothetical protein CFK40_06715 [Virgibacillus necropolis]